ncbi:MAG: serine hydrolase [Candidatus Parcubacteria bacterium]|jgi:predicted alpha/beta hydrolase family esterase|nr:serine hydrolase [Candidatus Parcubacteria bacterium]
MKPRIIFVPGNQSTHWSFAWAPWFKGELVKHGYPTFFETFPDSIIARSRYWLPFLEEHVQAGPDDVLVGWSSGATAAMRYAENHKILGSVLIAPCITDLDDELEKQSGYFDTPWEWEKIRANQKHVALVYGDEDPFTPREHFETIQKELSPEVIEIASEKHFIEREDFPQLLEHILRTYP